MSFENAVQLIANVGFPIFVATYLLLRLEPILKKNYEVQSALLEHLRRLNGNAKKDS